MHATLPILACLCQSLKEALTLDPRFVTLHLNTIWLSSISVRSVHSLRRPHREVPRTQTYQRSAGSNRAVAACRAPRLTTAALRVGVRACGSLICFETVVYCGGHAEGIKTPWSCLRPSSEYPPESWKKRKQGFDGESCSAAATRRNELRQPRREERRTQAVGIACLSTTHRYNRASCQVTSFCSANSMSLSKCIVFI